MTRYILWTLAFLSCSMTARGASQADPLVARIALDPSMKGPLSLAFEEDVSLQGVFQEVGRQAGIVVLFDQAFRDQTVAVDLGTVAAEEALEKLTLVNRLFYKILDPKTVIIIPDNAQKHRQYDEMLLHTFEVAHGDVMRVANMFRAIAGIQRVEPNPGQRSITVRATGDQLLVARSIVERNAKPPAELAFAVEVLAVDSAPEGEEALALGPEAYRRFQSETHPEVLFSETIRVTENETAHLSMGRSPKLSASEAPSEERGVGIELSLQPQLSPEGHVRVSLTMQATARDATTMPGDPASHRTRDLATTASLADGETTLVGGMFSVDELGEAFAPGPRADGRRRVVVAIRASLVRGPAAPESDAPLPMGTEQQIRVRR